MKRWTSPWFAALISTAFALGATQSVACAQMRESNASRQVLLGRARTSEARGRLDLASHDWVQVLLVDPNDAEALAGLVRAARAGGRTTEADYYLARLKASHPADPELARLEGGSAARGGGRTREAELAEAARLARTGDPRDAMVVYRSIYGLNPPPGPEALAYYETEAATEDGRPHAVAGLRALVDRFPLEPRYTIALGRVLLGNPRTRAEGVALLERYPGTPEAATALREGAEVPRHSVTPPPPSGVGLPTTGTAKVAVMRPQTAPASLDRHRASATEENAGFAALEAHRPGEAEQVFRDVLANDATAPRALAGLGYLRLLADDFKSALNYFVQAQANGDHSLALTRALVNAQFALMLERADATRRGGDLAGAEVQYRSALRERQADPEALEGLGTTLLQARRAEAAIPVYRRLTEVRPLDPGAWRGLVVAESGAGRSREALTAEAHEPAGVREPLSHDPIYLEALSKAREATGGTLLAQAQRAQETGGAQKDKRGEGDLKSQNGLTTAASPSKPSRPPVALVPLSPVPSAEATAADPAEKGRLALARGENARAAELFREAIATAPAKVAAWRGLVLALYAGGGEAEAVVAADQIPGPVRTQLETDATFQAAVGALYLRVSRPSEALHAFARAQNVFVAQKLRPPVNLLLGIAALLAARNDDANLYRELLYVGTRADLSDAERREVQRIWGGWAVRRARVLAAAGDQTRAMVLLNAAAGAFPGNADVVRAVADGYAGVGLPREATALYKALDLSRDTAPELERAVRAAIAAHDLKAAEGWLRVGRERLPTEPRMYALEAELEQARGHEARAVELSARAKALAPRQDPRVVLTAELREAGSGNGWKRGEAGQLSTLLAPSEALSLATGGEGVRPFLPTGEDVPVRGDSASQTPVLAGYDEPSR